MLRGIKLYYHIYTSILYYAGKVGLIGIENQALYIERILV